MHLNWFELDLYTVQHKIINVKYILTGSNRCRKIKESTTVNHTGTQCKHKNWLKITGSFIKS